MYKKGLGLLVKDVAINKGRISMFRHDGSYRGLIMRITSQRCSLAALHRNSKVEKLEGVWQLFMEEAIALFIGLKQAHGTISVNKLASDGSTPPH